MYGRTIFPGLSVRKLADKSEAYTVVFKPGPYLVARFPSTILERAGEIIDGSSEPEPFKRTSASRKSCLM